MIKNWLRKKLKAWLFADGPNPDGPRTRITEHRVINIPVESTMLRSSHVISSRELDDMIKSGRLTKEAAIQLIINEASMELIQEALKGGFVQILHTTDQWNQIGTQERIELQLFVSKPKI